MIETFVRCPWCCGQSSFCGGSRESQIQSAVDHLQFCEGPDPHWLELVEKDRETEIKP